MIYDGTVLFHGPMFHAVKSVEGASDQAISGTLIGRRELGWTDAPFVSDPALLDGGLQLAVLWVKRTLAGASLPTSIGAWVPYADARGPVHATAYAPPLGQRQRAVLDVTFTDAHGATVGELRDVEVHVLCRARARASTNARHDPPLLPHRHRRPRLRPPGRARPRVLRLGLAVRRARRHHQRPRRPLGLSRATAR